MDLSFIDQVALSKAIHEHELLEARIKADLKRVRSELRNLKSFVVNENEAKTVKPKG